LEGEKMNEEDKLRICGALRMLSEDNGQAIATKEELLRLIAVVKEC